MDIPIVTAKERSAIAESARRTANSTRRRADVVATAGGRAGPAAAIVSWRVAAAGALRRTGRFSLSLSFSFPFPFPFPFSFPFSFTAFSFTSFSFPFSFSFSFTAGAGAAVVLDTAAVVHVAAVRLDDGAHLLFRARCARCARDQTRRARGGANVCDRIIARMFEKMRDGDDSAAAPPALAPRLAGVCSDEEIRVAEIGPRGPRTTERTAASDRQVAFVVSLADFEVQTIAGETPRRRAIACCGKPAPAVRDDVLFERALGGECRFVRRNSREFIDALEKLAEDLFIAPGVRRDDDALVRQASVGFDHEAIEFFVRARLAARWLLTLTAVVSARDAAVEQGDRRQQSPKAPCARGWAREIFVGHRAPSSLDDCVGPVKDSARVFANAWCGAQTRHVVLNWTRWFDWARLLELIDEAPGKAKGVCSRANVHNSQFSRWKDEKGTPRIPHGFFRVLNELKVDPASVILLDDDILRMWWSLVSTGQASWIKRLLSEYLQPTPEWPPNNLPATETDQAVHWKWHRHLFEHRGQLGRDVFVRLALSITHPRAQSFHFAYRDVSGKRGQRRGVWRPYGVVRVWRAHPELVQWDGEKRALTTTPNPVLVETFLGRGDAEFCVASMQPFTLRTPVEAAEEPALRFGFARAE